MSGPAVQPPIKKLPPHIGVEPEGNSMGMAGFIVSVVSLFLCGVPAVIGLLLSLLGLSKQPRGFAVAGSIISCIALLEMIAFGFFLMFTFTAVQRVSTEGSDFVTEMMLASQSNRIGQKWEADGEIPSAEDGQNLVGEMRDIRGNKIRYETDGTSFSLRSAGRDGEMDTPDDITVGPFETAQEARQYMPDRGIPNEFREELQAEFGEDFQSDLKEVMREQQEAMEEMQRELHQRLEKDLDLDLELPEGVR